MKTKIISLALVIGLVTVLGACASETGGTGGNGTVVSPAPGTSPAESPGGAMSSPGGAMGSPGESVTPTVSPTVSPS